MNPRTLSPKLQAQKYLIIGKSLNMRLVEVEDASYILELRSNVKKNKFLTPVKQNLKAQQEWIMQYKQREAKGLEYYFLIESKAMQHLGVVRIYDFVKDSFCWGSWIIQENAPAPTAIESALNIYSFAFEILGFAQSHFDVRKENARVVAFHQRCGAKIVKEDALNYYFIFSKEDFATMKARYMKYLPLDNIERGGGIDRNNCCLIDSQSYPKPSLPTPFFYITLASASCAIALVSQSLLLEVDLCLAQTPKVA